MPESHNWIAEDLPAYLFDSSLPRPRNDVDGAMAGPKAVTDGSMIESRSRGVLVRYLHELSLAGINRANGMSHWYVAAGIEIQNGARMVRMAGRVYRLRDTDWCDRGAQFHGMCPSCDPLNYASYTRVGV